MRSLTRASISSALCFSTLALLAGVAEAEPSPTERPKDATMEWALRDSFLRYVGGATATTDGATKILADNAMVESAYAFTPKSISYDAAQVETRAEFQGTVEYFKYCDNNEPKQGNCALELKIKDPTVVINKQGGSVVADVRSKQYPSGEIFEGEDLPIADLDVANADFTSGSGKTQWKNLIPSLTQDGVQAFSGFYNIGSPLAPLTFSYAGEGGKPNIKSSPLKVVGTYSSPIPGDEPSRMFHTGDFLVVAGKNKIAAANPRTMAQVGELAAEVGENVLVAADKKNTVVWVSGNSVKSASLSKTGFGAVQELGTVPGTPVAVATSPDGGSVYVLSREGQEDAVLHTLGKAQTSVKLPDPRSVDKHLANVPAGDKRIAGFYSETYSFNPLRDMAVMPDGNLLYFNTGTVTDANNDYHPVAPMVITPQGHVSLALQPEAVAAQGGSTRMSAMVTDGNRVALYNDSFTGSAVQFFTYDNRSLTATSERGAVGNVNTISGVAFGPEGTAYVTAESDGSLNWVDTASVAVTDSLRLPNSKGTKGEHRMLIPGNNGELFANSVFVDTTNYQEFSHVLRLVDPTRLREDDSSNLPELPQAPHRDGSPSSSLSSGSSVGSKVGPVAKAGLFGLLLAIPALLAAFPALLNMLPPHLTSALRDLFPIK